MRIRKLIQFSLSLAIAAVSLVSANGQSKQPAPFAATSRPELALDFSYLRSNAPPNGCTCFNLYGGSATFALPLARGPISAVADFTMAQSGSIASNAFSLRLATYELGARYEPQLHWHGLHPFGQVLAGVAHSSGSLVSGSGTSVSNASAAFAGSVGGGVDVALSRRIWVRIVQTDYRPTTFDNGTNNHQNNLSLSSGIVIKF